MLSVRRFNKVISRFYSKGLNNSRQFLPNLANKYSLHGNFERNKPLEIIKIEDKDKYCNNSGPSGAVFDRKKRIYYPLKETSQAVTTEIKNCIILMNIYFTTVQKLFWKIFIRSGK